MSDRWSRMWGVVLLAGALTACGLSPQQVQPQPQLTGRYAVVAQGQQVQVTVRDGRSSPVLGTRGGLYQGNQLTVDGAVLVRSLQAEAESGLRQQGFQPAGRAERQLELVLTGLTYEVVDGRTAFGEVRLSATLLTKLHRDGANYQAEYVARLNKGFVKAPSAAANDALVSQVLTDALQRLFEDQAAARFLAQ